MKILLLILTALISWSVEAATNSVLATFDPSSSPASYISNYAIGYGQVSRGTNNNPAFSYPSNLVFSKTNVSVTVSNLGPGHWFFSAYAIATNGLTSFYSNEEGWTNRSFGPQNLRIQGPQDALALQSSGDLFNWKTLAVIVSSNQPLIVAAQPRSFFRTTNTSLPPLPR